VTRKKLSRHPVLGLEDVRVFFDGVAGNYHESHGRADRLLRYRLRVLRDLLPTERSGLLVEIGCGPGQHLLALAEHFRKSVGLDLSPAMIERAELSRRTHPLRQCIDFAVDPAEELATLRANTVDALICVGAFEHMLQKERVLHQIRRVLRRQGRFACLTPNGAYVWYRHLAKRWGCEVHHLSTDHFLSAAEFRSLLAANGLEVETLGYWTFVPRGDMPTMAGRLLDVLDILGRWLHIPALRGGLYVLARPAERQ